MLDPADSGQRAPRFAGHVIIPQGPGGLKMCCGFISSCKNPSSRLRTGMVCACKNFADGGRPMTRIVVGLIAWAPYFHCWIWMRCAPGAAPHNVCWMGLDSAGCSSSAAPPLITTPLSILMFASMRALPAASCCKSLWVRNLPMARRSLRDLWDSFSKARNNLRLADYRFCPRQHQIH